MKLIELLRHASAWDDDVTIYVARPWSHDANSVLISPSPDTTEPVKQDGTTYEYFLEGVIAREFMEDYAASAAGASASEVSRCQRLISYAENDA